MTRSRAAVVFGTGELSLLARYCLDHDSDWEVVAYTVDPEYCGVERFDGLPLLAFPNLPDKYPPGDVSVLVPLGYTDINRLRRDRFESAMRLGYDFVTYVSSRATTWPDLQIGRNCLVYEGAIVQPFTRIGDDVIVRSAAHLSHHTTIEDHCFIAAGVTLGGHVHVCSHSFIGVGAVVRDGVRLAERTFVGAGAVLLSDTEPDGVYVGNPARKLDKKAAEVTATRRE